MTDQRNVQQIIAWFEALMEEKAIDYERDVRRTRNKQKKLVKVEDKAWRDEMEHIIHGFDSEQKKLTFPEKRLPVGEVYDPHPIAPTLPARMDLTNIRSGKHSKGARSRNKKGTVSVRPPRNDDEYASTSAVCSSLAVREVRSRESQEIRRLQEESKYLAQSLEILEEDKKNLREEFQKKINLINLEIDRTDEVKIHKNHEMHSYRNIVHNPILLAAHLLYAFLYKPRRRKNFL